MSVVESKNGEAMLMNDQVRADKQQQDMIRITLVMHRAEWAVLKMWADMGDAGYGLGERVRRRLADAVIEEL